MKLEAMAMLQQRFLSGLERRIGVLVDLAARHDCEGLYAAFHSLAGIGGTYGHHDVTDAARAGEHAALAHDVPRVHAAIAELEQIRGGVVADRWRLAG